MDELIDKVFEKKIEWKGIITIRDYPRLDMTTGHKYSWITKKIKEFERNNPGVIIDFKPLDPQFGHIELNTAIKTNSCPDIAPIGSDFQIISSGALEPLDEYLNKDEINNYKPKAISAVKYENKIWGIPYMMETHCLFLNQDLFNERGVKLPNEGNWTYEEFVETLKQLTYDKNGDDKIDVFGFNSYIKPNSYSTWGILLSDGGKILDYKTDEYIFFGERAVSGLKKLIDLKLVHNVTPQDFGINNAAEAWRSFAIDKKVAVYPGKSSLISVLRLLNSRGKGFNIGIANYPIGEADIPISSGNMVTAYGIFKQEDKKKLEMCVRFLMYLTDDESQRELYKQGAFPVKRDIENIYKNDEIMSKLQKTLSNSNTIGLHRDWNIIDDILQTQIRMALLSKKTPEEAIKAAKEKIDKIIDNNQ
jgi:multiple sugar transport system substrate-binding protein